MALGLCVHLCALHSFSKPDVSWGCFQIKKKLPRLSLCKNHFASLWKNKPAGNLFYSLTEVLSLIRKISSQLLQQIKRLLTSARVFVADFKKPRFQWVSCCAQTKRRLAWGIITCFQKASEQMQKSRRFSARRLLLLCHLAAAPSCIAASPPMNVCKLLHEQTGWKAACYLPAKKKKRKSVYIANYTKGFSW